MDTKLNEFHDLLPCPASWLLIFVVIISQESLPVRQNSSKQQNLSPLTRFVASPLSLTSESHPYRLPTQYSAPWHLAAWGCRGATTELKNSSKVLSAKGWSIWTTTAPSRIIPSTLSCRTVWLKPSHKHFKRYALVPPLSCPEKRTQCSFKTIILAVYFDTSFISQVLNVEKLFFWRESAKALVLPSISLNCCSPICLTPLTAHTISSFLLTKEMN